jgi:hypothetical protein
MSSSTSSDPVDQVPKGNFGILIQFLMGLFWSMDKSPIDDRETIERSYFNKNLEMKELTPAIKKRMISEFREIISTIDINTCDPEHKNGKLTPLMWLIFQATDFGDLRRYFFTDMFLFVFMMLIFHGADKSIACYNPMYESDYSLKDKIKNTRTPIQYFFDGLKQMKARSDEEHYSTFTNYLYDRLCEYIEPDNEAKSENDVEPVPFFTHKSKEETSEYLDSHASLNAEFFFQCLAILCLDVEDKMKEPLLEALAKDIDDFVEDIRPLEFNDEDLFSSSSKRKIEEDTSSSSAKRERKN